MAKYIWPVPAWTGINQLFGTFPGGFNPPGGHTGTDYGTPIGTPIRAIADGVVKHADWFRGAYYDNPWLIEPSFAGIVVVIDHGECLSVYAHMNDTPLNPGQRVKQGQIIGHSGNTRNGVDVFGPHLHFEIMPDGWSVNNGTYGRVNPGRYCTEYWGVANETIIRPGQTGTTTTNKPKPAVKKVSELPKYKRVYPKPVTRELGKNTEWFLKNDGGKYNENYAVNGFGHYGIDLFIQGTNLPAGETVTVQFVLVPTGGKRSGYFEQEIHGSADGTFKGTARFNYPVLKAARIEASVKSSVAGAKLALYGAEVTTWAK